MTVSFLPFSKMGQVRNPLRLKTSLPLFAAAVLLAGVDMTISPGCASGIDQTIALRPLYDGRRSDPQCDLNDKKLSITKSEESTVNKIIFPQAEKNWKDEGEPSLKTLALLPGSFTKTGVKQKFLLYRYNDEIFGMAVLEDDNVVAHFGFKDQEPGDIKVIPGVSTAGRNAIAIEYWSMHQGFRHGMLKILELDANKVRTFGLFEIADDDLGSDKYYKFELSSTTGSRPQFHSTKYQKRRGKWIRLADTVPIKPRADQLNYVPMSTP